MYMNSIEQIHEYTNEIFYHNLKLPLWNNSERLIVFNFSITPQLIDFFLSTDHQLCILIEKLKCF